MKYIPFPLLLLSLFLVASCADSQDEFRGMTLVEYTGVDAMECMCCGNHQFVADDAKYTATELDQEHLDLLEGKQVPLMVWIKWKETNDCVMGGDPIKVRKMKLP